MNTRPELTSYPLPPLSQGELVMQASRRARRRNRNIVQTLIPAGLITMAAAAVAIPSLAHMDSVEKRGHVGTYDCKEWLIGAVGVDIEAGAKVRSDPTRSDDTTNKLGDVINRKVELARDSQICVATEYGGNGVWYGFRPSELQPDVQGDLSRDGDRMVFINHVTAHAFHAIQ